MAVLPTFNNLRAVLQKVIFVPIVYGFISFLPLFLSGWENSDRLMDRLLSTFRSRENMFDFVVVGSGAAGAVVANRLAEHYKVLLLEAGGTPMPLQTIPALALKFINSPQTDWSHKTVPQRKACLNSVNQQSSWSVGRGLGGTSNINFMAFMRGNPQDFNKWATDTGDPSWGYEGVLPYFKKSETFSGTSNDPDARGHDGELRIRKPSYVGLSEDWVRAGQEMGYPFVDLNGRHEEGFGILQYPIYKGIRQSTYASFLLPMHKSPRLTIRRYALVRKVLFRDMNNMAYGVEYVRHGRVETAVATKEVLLTAGTLGSSKLLMISGVGPRGHLEELGIPVRSELPVGRNLQDHLAVPLGPFFIKEPKSFLFDRDITPENIVRWLFLGTGPITTTGFQAAASIATSVAKSHGQGNWPDLQLILHGQSIHQGYTDAFAYAYSLQEDELSHYYTNAIGKDSFHIYVVGSRPSSTGQVLLSGSGMDDPLVINPRYLEDGGERDFRVLLEGVRAAFQVANSSIFQRLGTEFTTAKLPGCHDFEVGTDDYWKCYIRRFTVSMQNPVGTVPLGACVDQYLRVRGTRGLRVIDASIQPTLVSTGTFASTLMIAEKGVDMILKDHGIPDRDTDLFDVVFGRNGFFKKNPVLRVLQREFDTINPVRAILKPFTSRGPEIDARERFTRNGRVDNPLLQVISTVFGHSVSLGSTSSTQHHHHDLNHHHGSASDKVDRISLDSSKFNDSQLQHRFGQIQMGSGDVQAIGSKNVIGKNEWVFQTSSTNNIFGNPKKKGGRRFQLLQKILREEAEQKKNQKTTTNSKPSPTPPSVTTVLKPVRVEVVKFQKMGNSGENEKENEIDSGELKNPGKNENQLENSISINDDDLEIQAKPVSLHDSDTIPNTASAIQNSAEILKPDGNPFQAIIKGLRTFESFIKDFTAKDRPRPPSLPSSSSSAEIPQNSFEILPTQNSLRNSQNSNIFASLLSAFNSSNRNLHSNSKENNNPLSFLFGANSSPFQAKPAIANTPDLVNFFKTSSSESGKNGSGSNEDLQTSHNDSNNDSKNLFSSWFKPFGNNQLGQTSQSSQSGSEPSSWLKPILETTGSSGNRLGSSWFNIQPQSKEPKESTEKSPFSFFQSPVPPEEKEKSSSSSSTLTSSSSSSSPSLAKATTTTSSWFKPINISLPKLPNFLPISVTTVRPQPPPQPPSPKFIQHKDHLNDLLEILFGGLSPKEKKTVSKTLDAMLEAGESLVDIFAVNKSSSQGTSSRKHNLNNFVDLLEPPDKGKESSSSSSSSENKEVTSSENNSINSLTKNGEDFFQSLVTLANIVNAYAEANPPQTTTAKPVKSFLDFFSSFATNVTTEATATGNLTTPTPTPSTTTPKPVTTTTVTSVTIKKAFKSFMSKEKSTTTTTSLSPIAPTSTTEPSTSTTSKAPTSVAITTTTTVYSTPITTSKMVVTTNVVATITKKTGGQSPKSSNSTES